MAVRKLQSFGYTNVKAYKGGLEEWKAAGLALEHEKNKSFRATKKS